MDEEKKYRRISWIITSVIQVVLIVLLYFVVAWREPDPPIPEYGIELSFGLEQVGQGDPAPTEPDLVEEQNEEITDEESLESPEDQQPEEEPIEEIVEEEIEEIQENDSPDVVEEQPEETVVNQPEEEPVKEEPVEDPKPQPEKQEEKRETAPAKVESEKVTEPDPEVDQGNDTEEGTKGDPQSQIDERALYGENTGSQDGASLQMTGWVWDFRPEPKDISEETGKIVFEIVIDQDGYIISIKTLTSTVTPSVENIYRRSIEQLTFSKTSEYQPAPTSKGVITFILKSK